MPESLKLNRHALSVVACAHRGKQRYAVASICIEPDGGVIATDGRRLMRVSPFEPATDSPLSEPVLIARRDVTLLKTLLPKGGKLNRNPVVCLRRNGKLAATFRANDNGQQMSLTLPTMEGTFPPWRKVLPPKDREGAVTIGVDAELLGRTLLAVAKVVGRADSESYVDITVTPANEGYVAIVIEGKNSATEQNVLAVVMPSSRE